jgi:hypothetical protein
MKPETQYIRPQGIDSARYGFTDKMSAPVEHELSKCLKAAQAEESKAEQSKAVQHA